MRNHEEEYETYQYYKALKEGRETIDHDYKYDKAEKIRQRIREFKSLEDEILKKKGIKK